jgi:hypothetical protein
MQFISFTKSEVKLDGERADTKDNSYQKFQQRATAPDIDVNRLVSKGVLAKANSFIQQLQRAIFARQNDPRNMGKSITDCLSGSVQACRANPTYQYVEMSRVNLNEMPPRLARSSFTDGYFCELRVQVI